MDRGRAEGGQKDGRRGQRSGRQDPTLSSLFILSSACLHSGRLEEDGS